MLVLSRKPNEKVVINGDITITVVEVIGGRVKIGIEAPADVGILRGELVGRREDTAPALERADHGRAGLRPEPIIAAAIIDPLSKLRQVPR